MRRVAVSALVLCGCVLRSAVHDDPKAAREVINVAYYTGPDADQAKHRLNLFVPEAPGPRPVVVFVHGGGWIFGDRNIAFDQYTKVGRRLAQRGYLAAIISYRLAPTHKHPAQIEDVARAVAWTHAHAAEYGGDPSRIYLMGHSAGAHLIALAATDPRWLREVGMAPSDLAGIVAISGPYEVDRLGKSLFIGGPIVYATFGSDRAAWRDVCPARYLSAGAKLPPFLIASADGDFPMLRDYAFRFARDIRASGGKATELQVSAADHFSEIANFGLDGDDLAAAVDRFIAGR